MLLEGDNGSTFNKRTQNKPDFKGSTYIFLANDAENWSKTITFQSRYLNVIFWHFARKITKNLRPGRFFSLL